MENFSNPYLVKCTLLGRHGVGKSTMASAFADGVVHKKLQTTISIDFKTKVVDLEKYDQKIRIQIWDTAGQEKFRSIVRSYLRGIFIAFIVFDITDQTSWNEIEMWRDELYLSYGKYNCIPRIVLVATKKDKENHAIMEHTIQSKAKLWDCNYYIVSCFEEDSVKNITNMFNTELENLHQTILTDYLDGNPIPRGILERNNSETIYYQNNSSYISSGPCCF